MKHVHGGLAAFLFVFAAVVILHFAAIIWTANSESPAASAFAAAVG